MECLYERVSDCPYDCPYFYGGKCLMEDRYEPCVMDSEVWDDDDYDDICGSGLVEDGSGLVEDDSYDFDD